MIRGPFSIPAGRCRSPYRRPHILCLLLGLTATDVQLPCILGLFRPPNPSQFPQKRTVCLWLFSSVIRFWNLSPAQNNPHTP